MNGEWVVLESQGPIATQTWTTYPEAGQEDDMLDRHSGKVITAKTSTVLAQLKVHRARHKVVVAEAQTGYLTAARKALKAKLKELDSVRNPMPTEPTPDRLVSLNFDLRMPVDRTREYDTAIVMLELHLEAGEQTIELTATDVRRYIQDSWDWTSEFRHINAVYSASASLRGADE